MAGPGDEIATGAGGRGHLRASHADREQVIGILKSAFVQGMLAKDEFDLRVGQVLTSRTYAELANLTADLPAGLPAAQPPKPARAKGGQPILRPGQLVTGATILYAGVWVAAVFAAPDGVAAGMVWLGGLLYLSVLAIAMAVALENRQEKRSGGRLPRGQAPGAGGQALRRLPPASPGGLPGFSQLSADAVPGLTIYFRGAGGQQPDVLELGMQGMRRPKLAAYWDGCLMAMAG